MTPTSRCSAYHGADPAVLRGRGRPRDHADGVAPLRSPVARAITWLAARLPGAGGSRAHGPDARARGRCPRRPRRTPKPRLIADALRRAHLIDGVPWSQMAVIVARCADRRGCARAHRRRGMPVVAPATSRRSPKEPGAGAADGLRGRDAGRAGRRPALPAADRTDRPRRPGVAAAAENEARRRAGPDGALASTRVRRVARRGARPGRSSASAPASDRPLQRVRSRAGRCTAGQPATAGPAPHPVAGRHRSGRAMAG